MQIFISELICDRGLGQPELITPLGSYNPLKLIISWLSHPLGVPIVMSKFKPQFRFLVFVFLKKKKNHFDAKDGWWIAAPTLILWLADRRKYILVCLIASSELLVRENQKLARLVSRLHTDKTALYLHS